MISLCKIPQIPNVPLQKVRISIVHTAEIAGQKAEIAQRPQFSSFGISIFDVIKTILHTKRH